MSVSPLAGARGFVFDLDGCVWNGNQLNPGALETLAALDRAGQGIAFLTNNSRATGADVLGRLHELGVTFARHALTPLEIIGQVITERWGRSRVLVMGADEMAAVIVAAGHEVIEIERWREASVVAVGNDFDLTYERLTAACRAAARGAPLITPNVDPRLPIEGGDFLPGCGAFVSAVAVVSFAVPVVVGKPEPPLFLMALDRLGLPASAAVMVGDSLKSDIGGAVAVGMRAVLYAPDGARESAPAIAVVRSFAELARLAGLA
ncbi:MAG: HAD-IIA family hydrolase [Candidatus Rokubacteria bacterium]|nr:HAD-IIA family hydrolase [Candidatus Rokubacteria bacterium]MBI3826056.1 HAD-IIA family hydrolase [Candidatus Rokubacteria bacterium]